MKDDNARIEQRIQNMRKFYIKAGEMIDNLPPGFPEKVKKLLKDQVLGDQDLKTLMDGIDAHRPPRIFVIGRTGVGKSSLINALCDAYVAGVSDVTSGTETASIHQCKDGDRVLMEIMDTRGIAESESLDSKVSAEEMLIDQVNEFMPDVAILVLSCTHRDDVDSDVDFLKKLAKSYIGSSGVRLPIVVAVNKCDEMAPSRYKAPSEYPASKIAKIEETVQYYKGIIVKSGLKIDDIVAVSSLIDWQTPDGLEIGVEDIENLPQKDIDNLQKAFDGRYNIDRLLDILDDAILDIAAQMGLRMAARLNDVVRRLAKHLSRIFSTISGIVATTPIPVSDIYILVSIQALLVCMIAALSGRDVSMDAAKEFILSLGGVVGAGYLFRLTAQQATKLLNGLFPFAGSAVSSGIAAFGTSQIGEAAIAYYIDGHDLDEAKTVFETAMKEKKGH